MRRFVFASIYFSLTVFYYSFSQAQSLTLRFGAPPGTRITNCTNASPIVCTADIAHGLSNGDMVYLSNILGNTAANGKRFVQVVSPTTVALYSDSARTVPVAGNGGWIAGSGLKWMGKAADFPIVTGHPRVIFDGPNGALTRAVRCSVGGGCLSSITVAGGIATASVAPGWTTSQGGELVGGNKIGIWNAALPALNGTYTLTGAGAASVTFVTSGVPDGSYSNSGLTISRYAFAGNPAWDQLVSATDGYSATYVPLQDYSASRGLMSAIRYFVDRSFVHGRTVARNLLTNAMDLVYGTTACSETTSYCGSRIAAVDYPRFTTGLFAAMYSILEATGDVTSGERATVLDQIFNDRTTESQTCTKNPVTTSTVSLSCSGTTCTAVSGLSNIPVGSMLYLNPTVMHEDSIIPVRAISVTDTSITISSPRTYTGVIQYGRGWQSGDCGILWVTNHHAGSPATDPVLHPSTGGVLQDGGGVSYYHNLTLSGFLGNMMTGMAFVDSDVRARRLVEKTLNPMYDLQIGYSMQSWTGYGQYGSTYDWYRSPWMFAEIAFMLKSNILGYLDLSNTNFILQTLRKDVYSSNDRRQEETQFLPFGEGSYTPTDYALQFHASNAKLFPSSPVTANWKYWIQNRHDRGNGVAYGDNQSFGSWFMFLGIDPNLAAQNNSALPKQAVFNQSGYSVCSTLGMRYCNSPIKRFDFGVSRTGWTAASTKLYVNSGTSANDHQGYDAGHYTIDRGQPGNQPCLVGADSVDCAPGLGLPKGSQLYLGTGFPFASIGFAIDPPPEPTPLLTRAAVGNDKYAYFMGDLTGLYSAATGVSRAHRHWVHLKSGAKEFVVLYDNVVTQISQIIRTYTHLTQNGQSGEGNTVCSGDSLCSTLNTNRELLSTTGDGSSGMTTKYLAPAGVQSTVLVDSSSGAYSGGSGHSFRVTACTGAGGICSTAANTFEMITVHDLVVGAPSALVIAAKNPSDNWTGFSSGNHTVMFARTSQLQNTMPPISTSAATDLFVTGLTDGLYDVRRDGVVVCDNIGSVYSSVYCDNVLPGSIDLLRVGSLPTPGITTSSPLATGVVGVPYSQSLQATGGAAPYSFGISAGE